MVVLNYKEYRKFLSVIDKSIVACKNSNQPFSDHFGQVTQMLNIESQAKRKLKNDQIVGEDKANGVHYEK